MIRNFKVFLYAAYLQPGRTPMAIGTLLLATSVLARSWCLYLIAMIILVAVAVWQKVMLKPIDENFAVLPSIPILDGKPYLYLCQRRRSDVGKLSCKELRRMLISDKRTLNEALPQGTYQTMTHENVLRIFNKCSRIHIEVEPKHIYEETLHHDLMRLTKGRCRRCKNRCAPWSAPARDFYYVRFTVS